MDSSVNIYLQDLSVTVMSDLPPDEVELMDDPDEVHKIYKQSFIDEQVCHPDIIES